MSNALKRINSNSTNKIFLEQNTSENNTEKKALNFLKNKQSRELRLTNLNSVQLSNVNMSDTFSNNPILRIGESTIIRVDKKSDTDVIDRIKNIEDKKRKAEFNKTNEKENERNVSFNNFQPLNERKISTIQKAKNIMYDNKMSKLIDYFQQGGI